MTAEGSDEVKGVISIDNFSEENEPKEIEVSLEPRASTSGVLHSRLSYFLI